MANRDVDDTILSMSLSKLEVDISFEDSYISVDLIGRASFESSTALQSQIDELIQRKEKIILFNCDRLESISSAILRVILKFAKQAMLEKKKIAFYSLNEHVHRVFNVSGFLKILPVYDNREKALATLQLL